MEQLRLHFPEYEVEEIDLTREFLRTHRWMLVLNFLHIWRLYWREILTRRHPWRQCFFRTPYLFQTLRRLIRRRLARRRAEYAFSFQTQSLFDASLPGLPHFVYTDHAHLTNLCYPAFSREGLFARSWIDLEREIYQHATHIYVMGEHVRRSLLEQYGCDPARVTCILAGSNAATEALPLVNGGYTNCTIVFVGVEWERKGGPALLEAFTLLLGRLPEARLIVVGCTPPVEHPRVEIVGRVAPEEVRRHLVRASVFCLPTRIEPFGIAPIEAFVHGLPVVTTRIGAMPDLVQEGESGRLVAPDDPAGLAEALLELLTDPEKCRSFAAHGRRHVSEHYTWAAVGRRLRDGIVAAL